MKKFLTLVITLLLFTGCKLIVEHRGLGPEVIVEKEVLVEKEIEVEEEVAVVEESVEEEVVEVEITEWSAVLELSTDLFTATQYRQRISVCSFELTRGTNVLLSQELVTNYYSTNVSQWSVPPSSYDLGIVKRGDVLNITFGGSYDNGTNWISIMAVCFINTNDVFQSASFSPSVFNEDIIGMLTTNRIITF